PDYATNGHFYVIYTPGTSTLAHWVLARYTCNPATPDVADPNSEHVVLKITYDIKQHRSSWMEFRGGYLFVSTGDGGENDPANAASNTSPVTGPLASQQYGLRGKILCLDVHDGDEFPTNPDRNYRIPEINPWAFDPTKAGEIWAYGLRNPWRASFDTANGDLYIGDVGQSAREEINAVPGYMSPPYFFGWRCREGTVSTGLAGCPATLPPSITPILDYPHSGANPSGLSVTGGFVYRGCAIPGLEGAYFFADWTANKIWSFRYNRVANTRSPVTDRSTELAVAGSTPMTGITSFGTDAYGEIYWTRGGTGTGEVWKLIPRTLQGADCNANSKTDACEIAANPALDLNTDGVIDTCQPCGPADLGRQGGEPGFDRQLDNNDFIVFIGYFFDANPAADLGQQGGLPGADTQFDNNDFIAFIDFFFTPPAGC
ncbi:MAG: PQQ-dependent sugar dehydrogenase, partial [Phycisphaerales bacterium]|nr:PQQ-dependent sugar dehydrogenase [Phycisphaerales bacterium]